MQSVKRIAIITSALFLFAAAAVVNQAQLYFMATLLICLWGVAYLIARQSLGTIEVRREVPASGWEGEVATFHLVVHSRSPLPKLMLQMRDPLPAWLERDSSDAGYFDLPAAREVRIPYSVLLRKRGRYVLDEVSVISHDPLGLFTISRTWRAPAEVLVYPVPQAVAPIGMTGADRFGSYEMVHTAIHGTGSDPDTIRQYQAGDSLRRIHWKSLARTGELNVVEYEEALMLHVVLLLDTSVTFTTERGPDSPFEYLVRMAASLADGAAHSGATFRIVTDEFSPASMPGRGQTQLYSVLDALARVDVGADRKPPSADLYERIGLAGRGTSIIALTAGTDPALPGALARYTAAGVHASVIYADPRSFDPGLRSPSAATQRTFFDALLGSQVALFVMKHDDGQRLAPERVYGSFITVG